MIVKFCTSMTDANEQQMPQQRLPHITYKYYTDERYLPLIKTLIEKDLSEPYSIFTYRYFLNQWPRFTLLAMIDDHEEDDDTHAKSIHENSSKTTSKSYALQNIFSSECSNKLSSQCSRQRCIGAIVAKLERDANSMQRGYIAMLAVDKQYRRMGIAKTLVCLVVQELAHAGADLVVLEAECSNDRALRLYESLNFVRSRLLRRYYLNGSDAYRLKRWLTRPRGRRYYIGNIIQDDGDVEVVESP